MKARNLLNLTAALGALVLMSVSGQAVAQTIELKLAHGATSEQAIGQGMEKFAELVGEKTNGKVKVQTYLAGSLYNERTALEALVNGSIDLAGASNGNWAAFTDSLLFMDLPYVFKDEETFNAALHGGIGQEIGAKFEESGFKLLMILNNGGFRDVVNNARPIKKPSDLEGLKFRTTASPVEQAMFEHWGAIPTAIDWAEVYTALSAGIVDGEFVMPSWLASSKQYEVLKYATHNKAVIGVQTLAMLKTRFDSLPADVQEAMLAAAKEAQAYNNKVDEEQRQAALAYAKELGVEFYTPTEQEMDRWRETGREVWEQFSSQIDKDFLKRVLASQE